MCDISACSQHHLPTTVYAMLRQHSHSTAVSSNHSVSTVRLIAQAYCHSTATVNQKYMALTATCSECAQHNTAPVQNQPLFKFCKALAIAAQGATKAPVPAPRQCLCNIHACSSIFEAIARHAWCSHALRCSVRWPSNATSG
jgi:hypothetical protein